MANEIENLDSSNGEIGEAIILDENDDVTVVKEKFNQLSEAFNKTSEANKKLYTRAKQAEGFEMKDGKWFKPEKPSKANENPSPNEPSKPNELDMGTIAYLNSLVGLKGKDEIALAHEYIASGKSVIDLAENKFFKQDLQVLREAKESANAIPKGKNRSGQTGVTDVDMATAKFNETGELPDDLETRVKVVDAVTKSESKPLFHGSSVVM